MSRSFSGLKPTISQSSYLQLGSKPTELTRLPYRRNVVVPSRKQNLFLFLLKVPLTNELRLNTNVNPFFRSYQRCSLWQLQTSPTFWNFNSLFKIRRTSQNTIVFTVTALTNSNLTSIFLPPLSRHTRLHQRH